jgi:hypothetical protein
MKTKQLIIYALLAYFFYKIFISKEGFALSTGIIPLADLQSGKVTLDPTKQYYRGIRNTSSTITPQINGGKGCTEYPDVVFKPVPATDAVCRTWSYPDLQDNMYNFDTTAYPGSYHQKIIGLPTTSWVGAASFTSPEGVTSYRATRLFQGRMQCLTTNGKDCLWRQTMSEAQSDAIKANELPAPSILVIGGPQWPYVPADTVTDADAVAFRLARGSSITNAQLTI